MPSLSDIGGMKNGRLFNFSPEYIDVKKAPGFSTLPGNHILSSSFHCQIIF